MRLWVPYRDFFQFSFLQQRDTSLPKWETKPLPDLDHIEPEERFKLWCQGKTGFPFVDASMRELAATGYMSNRSRQNAASLLTKARLQIATAPMHLLKEHSFSCIKAHFGRV